MPISFSPMPAPADEVRWGHRELARIHSNKNSEEKEKRILSGPGRFQRMTSSGSRKDIMHYVDNQFVMDQMFEDGGPPSVEFR